jgi:hypothetical protein
MRNRLVAIGLLLIGAFPLSRSPRKLRSPMSGSYWSATRGKQHLGPLFSTHYATEVGSRAIIYSSTIARARVGPSGIRSSRPN